MEEENIIHSTSASGVQFETQDFSNVSRIKKDSLFVRAVISLSGGKIQNKNQANILLLAFATFVFIISFAIAYFSLRGISPPDKKDIIEVAGPDQIKQR